MFYQAAIDVTNQSQFPIMPDWELTWTPRTYVLVNEHPTARVAVSFDGIQDSIVLVPNTPSAALLMHQQVRTLYCRRIDTGIGITIRITAEI